MSVEPDFETVPKIVMHPKNFTCPICWASVWATVDIFAAQYEEIPHEVEMHLQWHDLNDRNPNI